MRRTTPRIGRLPRFRPFNEQPRVTAVEDRAIRNGRLPQRDGREVGPVGWRLPMEHTDIESHEVESSRRITATPAREARQADTGERAKQVSNAWLGSFRVTRECHRPRITRLVYVTVVSMESRPSCAWQRQGRRDERLPVCGMGGAGR